jgi:hypothetical protein
VPRPIGFENDLRDFAVVGVVSGDARCAARAAAVQKDYVAVLGADLVERVLDATGHRFHRYRRSRRCSDRRVPEPRRSGHYRQPPSRLPLNLLDALRAFQTSTPLRKALGSDFVDSYVKLRMAQWSDYMRHLTEREREHTLDA